MYLLKGIDFMLILFNAEKDWLATSYIKDATVQNPYF